jgi:hypothetical protein
VPPPEHRDRGVVARALLPLARAEPGQRR